MFSIDCLFAGFIGGSGGGGCEVVDGGFTVTLEASSRRIPWVPSRKACWWG